MDSPRRNIRSYSLLPFFPFAIFMIFIMTVMKVNHCFYFVTSLSFLLLFFWPTSATRVGFKFPRFVILFVILLFKPFLCFLHIKDIGN